jgi:phosphohistidine phosphatase
MELILWRHADAEDGKPDLERKLTPKGHEQAARVAKWLRKHLPSQFSVVASPAVRAQQTAAALGVQVKTIETLAPGASVDQILAAARNKKAVVIVGHQPDLGRALAHLVAGARSEWHIEKGGFWWLAVGTPVVVRAVLSPDLL